MRLGIVSDTHGHVPYAADGARMLEAMDVAAVLHCGDVGSREIVRLFSKWPAHFVAGNVDHGPTIRDAAAECGSTYHGAFGTVEIGGVRIALLHGDDSRRLAEAIGGGEFALVCHGHTHVAGRRLEGSTVVLNPGALYRATPHTVAIVELPSLETEIIAV
jgi:putative phosphoesterase